eukprot:COSAG06_NODE_31977_length_513_cov_0.874396_1_plen_162_part_10
MKLAHAYWEGCRDRPEEDEERLHAQQALASAHADAGDFAAARRLYEEMVAVIQRMQSDGRQSHDHPINLLRWAVFGNLGCCVMKMGEHAKALPLIEEALPGLRRTLGDEHEQTLATIACAVHVYDSLGMIAEARLLLEEAVAVRRRTLPTHFRTFTSIENLG